MVRLTVGRAREYSAAAAPGCFAFSERTSAPSSGGAFCTSWRRAVMMRRGSPAGVYPGFPRGRHGSERGFEAELHRARDGGERGMYLVAVDEEAGGGRAQIRPYRQLRPQPPRNAYARLDAGLGGEQPAAAALGDAGDLQPDGRGVEA